MDPIPGDIVLLRNRHSLIAIGEIPDEGYSWEKCFDDIDGWNLQHTRRVIWQEHLDDEIARVDNSLLGLFSTRKQVPTFTRVRDSSVLQPVTHLIDRVQSRPLKEFVTNVPDPLSMDQVGTELFAKGLSNEVVDRVVNVIERQRRLTHWYQEFGKSTKRPTEHEVVAYMILPLLLALGWSEQLLAIEWNKLDLAGFTSTPTTKSNCVLICEAKRLGHGLNAVLDQATGYYKKHNLNACKKIVLSDGVRLYSYTRQNDGKFETNPSGYFNVEKIRTNHITPSNTNAIDTIVSLTPAGLAVTK